MSVKGVIWRRRKGGKLRKPCWECNYPRGHKLCCCSLEHRRERSPAFAEVAREETELLELLERPARCADDRPGWRSVLRG